MASKISIFKSIHSLLFCVAFCGFFSCTSILYVAPKQVECNEALDQKCFLVRSKPEGNWISHYTGIDGLEYEPGFAYELKVKKERIKDPGIDGSTFKYDMIEVLEKRDVTDDIEPEDLMGKTWYLEYLKFNNMQFGVEDKIPTLEFKDEAKVGGNGGCNNFFGNFSIDGRTIHIGDIGATRMMCEGSMELEQAYTSVLGMPLRALFNENKLICTADGGNQLIFRYK